MPAFLLALIIGPAVVVGKPMPTTMTTRDTYVEQLAAEVRDQLQQPAALEYEEHRALVRMQRDDGEDQGIWFTTRSYGYSDPKHVFVHGLWPKYRERLQYPGNSLEVKVSYGREVRLAARDIIRRFEPWYASTWQQMLSAVVNMRDRDLHRELFLEELAAMPGVTVRRYQDNEQAELLFDGPQRHYLDLQLWGTGEVSVKRGSLSDELVRRMVRNLVEEPAPLYGEAARRHRYEQNEKRQVLGTLKDIADVLERNEADVSFAENRKRIALELRLRGVQLKGDDVSCYLGKTWCRFKWYNLQDLIRTANDIYRNAA